MSNIKTGILKNLTPNELRQAIVDRDNHISILYGMLEEFEKKEKQQAQEKQWVKEGDNSWI